MGVRPIAAIIRKMLSLDYAQPSCTAGRSAFITGQLPVRTGMHTVGFRTSEESCTATPGNPEGVSSERLGSDQPGSN